MRAIAWLPLARCGSAFALAGELRTCPAPVLCACRPRTTVSCAVSCGRCTKPSGAWHASETPGEGTRILQALEA
eukprot:8292345-Alexandrium_andersonii.AAC.1